MAYKAGDKWREYIKQFSELDLFFKNLRDNHPATELWLAQQIDIFAGKYPSHPEQGEQGELYKWVKATSDNLPKFNDVIPRQVFAIRYKNVSGSYNYGWLTANQISDYRKSSPYNDLEWLCKLSSPPPEGQDELWEQVINHIEDANDYNWERLKSEFTLIKK